MTSKNDITCIYCEQRRPSSAAHVIPRALGGDLTARTNCAECNREMGKLDQALAERSLLALSRVVETPKDSLAVQISDVFIPSGALVLEGVFRNRLSPVLLPQIHIGPTDPDGKNEFDVVASSQHDLEGLLKAVDDLLDQHALRSVHVKVGPTKAGPRPRLVFHRLKSAGAFVRVAAHGDEEILYAALERAWSKVAAHHRSEIAAGALVFSKRERPQASVLMSFSLDDEYRAVARIAFDFLAARFGSDIALQPGFHAVRAYIRGHAVINSFSEHPEAIPHDARFVQRMEGEPVVPTDAHLLVLCWIHGEVCAVVTLYRRNVYAVRLGPCAVDLELPAAHEFSITRAGNHERSPLDLYERVRDNGRSG